MKLINRSKPLINNKRERWGQWGPCEGSTGLTRSECEGLVIEWSDGGAKWIGDTARVTSQWEVEEFRVVEDGFCCETLNKITEGTYLK